MTDNKSQTTELDPLTAAQMTAIRWCKHVKRKAEYVSRLRRDFESALFELQNDAIKAEKAVADARAMKAMRNENA